MALVVAHIDLAKAEAGAIAGQVGRVFALGALAFILVVFAIFLLVIGVGSGSANGSSGRWSPPRCRCATASLAQTA